MPDRFIRFNLIAEKFFTVTPRRIVKLLLFLIIMVALNSPAVAAGPLRVNPLNTRYFSDTDGATVFLAGSYQNPYNLLNGESWDLNSYFDYLAHNNHNFTRLWAWEQSPWMFDANGQVTYSLQPFERTGSSAALDGGVKFDLARFNQAYFDQLRSRVIQAGQRGIYVSVILFEGFSSQRRVREVNPWLADPFQRDNNINGIDADPNGNGRGEEFFSLKYPSLTTLQEAFVRKVVDTLNDLDNVLYEISGDTLATSLMWQYHMIDYLKQYQSNKANQHPVGISQFNARKLAEVLNSRADWLVTQGTDFNPPLVNGNKVVFNEGQPVLFNHSNPDQWVWRAFTRGYNLIYPEVISDDAEVGERVHAAIGQVRAYSQFLDLSTMFPSTSLCSKGFCLGSRGSDYLVYLPSGGPVSIDLSAVTANFLTAWFDPATGQTISGNGVSGGKRTALTSPIRGQSVLQISPSGQTRIGSLNTPSTSDTLNFTESSSALQEMISTPKINPNGGIYSGSVRVSLSTKTQNAAIYYTTDGKSPTQLSKKYTGAFTLNGSILVKAKAFKAGKNPSVESSAWFADIGNATGAFNFTLATSGDKSVSAGSSIATTITATLGSTTGQTVSFAVSGLPSGATAAFSSASCTPTCSSTLTISTSGSTPAGNYPVSISASGGGQTRTTSFNLSVSPTPISTLPPTNTWTSCALENYHCSFSGTKQVRYGVNGTYVSQIFSNGVYCANSIFGDPLYGYVKACDVRDASDLPFDFTIANSGNMSLVRGSSGTNSISARPVSGSAQSVSFSVSGLPSGVTVSFSSATCSPTCSTVLTISTTSSTTSGSFPITVTATGGGVTRSTVFTLSVTFALTVATPTFTPNGGNFTDLVSVAIQTATPGASIYYTTDGSIPTQSSTLYKGPMALTASATLYAKAFMSGLPPSTVAAATFINSSTIRTTSGKTYYVATDGRDSNSCAAAQSTSTPKRNIMGTNGGLSCLVAGNADSLEIRSGTYSDRITSVVSGTNFSNAATIRAHFGETVTITGGIALEGPSYVIFQDLKLTTNSIWVGSTFQDGSNAGHHIRFVNINASGAGTSFNIVELNRWAHHVEVIGGDFHHADQGTYAFYISGDDNKIEGATVRDNSAYGFHIYSAYPQKPDRNTIRFNAVYNNGTLHNITTAITSAILLGSGDNNVAYGNWVYRNGGNGIESGHGATNSEIYNNTVFANNFKGSSYGGIVWGTGNFTTIKNNIVYQNAGGDFVDSYSIQTPAFVNNFCTNAGKGCAFNGNPLFVDSVGGNFALFSTSPAINQGPSALE